MTGHVQLFDDALVEFASGQLDAIASGGQLQLNGPNTFVADAGATGSNSALTGLDSVVGELDLDNGAVVAVNGDLVDDGSIFVDFNGNEGGSHLTVAGALTNSGRLQVGNGALSADDSLRATGLANSGNLTLFGSTTAQANLDIDGNATNAANLTVGAGAELEVSAGHAYAQSAGTTRVDGTLDASTVTVTGGTLEGSGTITGNLDNAATVQAGDSIIAPAALTVSGNYVQHAGAVFTEVVTGTGVGQHGVLQVGGSVDLQGGTLQIGVPGGFSLAAGQSFTVMTFAPGSLTGTFSTIADGIFSGSVNSVNIAGGLTLDVVYDNAGGRIDLDVVNSPVADSWLGGAGQWSNSADWSSGVPTAQSLVDIGATGSVALDQDATVSQLTVETGGSLELGQDRTLAVTGSVLADGQLRIDNRATLEIGGGEAGTVAFNGSGGTLRLDAPANFTGQIDSFGQGDLLALANTDVTSVAFAAGTLTATLHNGTTVQLTLTDNLGSGGFVVTHNGSESDITEVAAPVLNAPAAQAMLVGVASQINALSVADANVGAGVLTVTLSAASGVFAAKALGGGTVSGSGTGHITLTGTLADINNELVGVTYAATAEGTDSIDVAVADALGASVSKTIAVVNGPMPSTQLVLNAPDIGVIVPGQQNGIPGLSVSDPFAAATGQQVTVTFSAGTLPQTFLTSGGPGAP